MSHTARDSSSFRAGEVLSQDKSNAFNPPFNNDVFNQSSKTNSNQVEFDDLFPAAHRNKDTIERPSTDLGYLEQELNVKRLNTVHEYLWLAGRPMPPRPLHYQKAAARDIVVVEQMDLHLLWEASRIYLKPIPRYLLNHDFWKEILVCHPDSGCPCSVQERHEKGPADATVSPISRAPTGPKPKPISRKMSMRQPEENLCRRVQLYKCAFGFLLSYTALIQYESDFRIAQNACLLPDDMKWLAWRELAQQLLSAQTQKNFNMRFWFGELRIDRLNLIYRYRLGSLRGYKFGHQSYHAFFHDHLAPIVSFIAYIAIVLTAMQVGLATDTLGQNASFQQASYGFAVFSILSPLILVGLVACGALLIFLDNLFSTLSFNKKRVVVYDQTSSKA